MSRALTDDETITTALLLGVEFYYDDYGHPERAGARQYHQCVGRGFVRYGHSQVDAARKWLRDYPQE